MEQKNTDVKVPLISKIALRKCRWGSLCCKFPAIHLKTVKRAIHTFWRAYCGSR